MVSTLMELTNALSDRLRAGAWRTATFHEALETLLLLLAPAAPHIAEELWHLTGHDGSVHQQSWPVWNADLAREVLLQVPVQINGRLREVIDVPSDASPEEVEQAALAQPRVQQHLAGHRVVRSIYVSGKVLNMVVESE
jgi:leucyl-tRNA synthetase